MKAPGRLQRRGPAALVCALAVALAAAGYWFYSPASPPIVLPQGQSLESAQLEALATLPAFSLDRAGAPLTPAALRGRWSFLFFGYTNCPNACPATLGILNHVQEALQAQGVAPPRIVFISLDPQRDTPQVLARYTAEFGADTLGATGSASALKGLLTFFGITYERHDGGAGGQDKLAYTLDHTTNFFLVTPDGRWLATFSPADDAEGVLEDTRTLMRLALP
jgi:protein SCO1/2